MSPRVRLIGPIAAVIALSTTAVILLARPEARPPIAEIAALAEAGRLRDAESRLAPILERWPRDPGANLLAAQVAMGRTERSTGSGIGTDPEPAATALEHLGRVKTRDEKLAALVGLWRGKAERYLGRLEEAEASWLDALRRDPAVPEAGWLLLQEYYLQGRAEEARSLALRLHRDEPDRRDRVLLLLEPIRQDVTPPAPASLVLWFEPIAGRSPAGFRARIALGLALVRSSEIDRGIGLLRDVTRSHPDRSEAWDALMSGLDETGEIEELSRVLESLPDGFRSADWAARYRGRVLEDREAWADSALWYRRAIKASPADHRLGYRLARVLRRVGEPAEADRLDARHQARPALIQESRTLYESAVADGSLGLSPHPELYEKLARLREEMGFPDQARAWHRLAEPGNSR